MTTLRRLGCALLAVAACGHRSGQPNNDDPYKAPAEQMQGNTACGGSLSLLGDWQNEKPGELIAKGTVAGIDRIEHGIRVTFDDARSFVISLARELAPPLVIGDAVDVSIVCQPVGWNALDCSGTVIANGELVAFDALPPSNSWKIERGPLLERRGHPNYGPTSHYGLQFTHEGVTVTSPFRGCAELRTPRATYRVSGGEVEHADPRAADSADTFHFNVIRVP